MRSYTPPLGPSKRQKASASKSPASIIHADTALCSSSSTETLDCLLVPWPRDRSTSRGGTAEQQVTAQLIELAELIYVQGLDCRLPQELLRCDAATLRKDLRA